MTTTTDQLQAATAGRCVAYNNGELCGNPAGAFGTCTHCKGNALLAGEAGSLLATAKDVDEAKSLALGWIDSAADRGDVESVRLILAAYHRRAAELGRAS